MSRKTAIGLLILTGVLWSTAGFMIKIIPWPPMAIAGLRSGFAATVIFFYSRPKEFTFGKNTWGGALFYALMVLCFVTANKMTTAGNVILIQYAAPVYVALFGFSFLGEKSTKVDWLAIIIILTGLGCFFLDDLSFDQLWGNIVALVSGFGFAGLTLLMRKQKHDRPIDSVLLGNLITFLLCSPFYSQGITFELEPWAMIIFLGVIQLGLAYILYSIAIKYVSALDAIIYPVIEPIFNPMFAFLFLGEAMSSTAQIGGVLVLLGVIGRGLIQKSLSST
ncbi:uncharacterized protein METZ01_LOCUS333543 [marine metagenome]|uniref:EamA domain-containing protein n=1 Tax=marine metagenome TaxID=408172 RepID=A0A382Q538_9ZZZZ